MFQGVFSLLQGMKVLLQTHHLRTVVIQMFTCLLLLSMLVFVAVVYFTAWIASFWLPTGEAWWWSIVGALVWCVSFVFAASWGGVMYVIFSGMVTGSSLDKLAAYFDQEPVSDLLWLAQLKQSAVNTTKPLLMLVGWGSISLMLFFIPFVGVWLAGVTWFYGCMRFLSFELIDVPCSRRQMGYKERKELMIQHCSYYSGFGLAAMGLMMIPIVNMLIHPSAVVGLMLHAEAAGLKSVHPLNACEVKNDHG